MSIFTKILGQTGIDMAEKAADIADIVFQLFVVRCHPQDTL